MVEVIIKLINMKKILIGILMLAVIIGFGLLISKNNKDDKGFGQSTIKQITPLVEATIFSGIQDTASASTDGVDDFIVIESDPGSTYASVSVGDTIRGDGTNPFLTSGVNYFVIIASASDRFAVSLIPGGPKVDLASSNGSNSFYRNAPSVVYDVGGFEHITISVNAEEAPSLSFRIVGSIQGDGIMQGAPIFYASSSYANRWDYLGVYDLEVSSISEGTTTTTLAGTDYYRMFEIFPKNLKWASVIVDNYASGSLNIKLNAAQ